jgi:hypothetical protein
MIQIDIIGIFMKRLLTKGWNQNRGYGQKDSTRVLERNGIHIAAVKPIRINSIKTLESEIEKFFKTLMGIIQRKGIKIVFLPGGGTIPVPQFFLDFCKKNGVEIHILTAENIDQHQDLGEFTT